MKTKFDSKCSGCSGKVAKGTGDVTKGAQGKWVVKCDDCVAVAATRVRETGTVRTCACGTDTTLATERTGCTGATIGWTAVCRACAVEQGRARLAVPAPTVTRTTFEDRLVRMVSPEGAIVMVHEPDVYDAKKDGFRVA